MSLGEVTEVMVKETELLINTLPQKVLGGQ